MRICLKFLFIPILICSCSSFLFSAQKQDEPSWVYLKKAENLKEKGDYANAIVEARKSKNVFINEKLEEYKEYLLETERDKTDFEIRKILEKKRLEMLMSDDYPAYHELMGDLYVFTDFLSEAEKEYKTALGQKKFFEYKGKFIEIKYKLAEVYEKSINYEVADIIYREIADEYLKKRDSEIWFRYRDYIKKDTSLNHLFRIFREDGIEYQKALYKIGRRSALMGRYDDALFYLSNAAVVFMKYNSDIVKKRDFEFQYEGPVDFIQIFNRKDLEGSFCFKPYYFDETLFYLGYSNQKKSETGIADYFYDLAVTFSKFSKSASDMKYRTDYLKKNSDHKITYDEIGQD
jgi:hypothetical protein